MRLKIIVVFFRFEIQKQFLDKLTLCAIYLEWMQRVIYVAAFGILSGGAIGPFHIYID
jgi:hypothetical protein